MLDLNHILLFISCMGPLVVLAQSWRKGGLDRGWRIAAVIVLLVTVISWIFEPDTAGFVGGAAWFALLFLPSIGLRKASEFGLQQRYSTARKLLGALRLLHPVGDLAAQSDLLRAMELAQRGDFGSALALLATLENVETTVGRQAMAQSFRIRGDWAGLLRWLRGAGTSGRGRIDIALLSLYLRALGEIGARNDLLLEFGSKADAVKAVPQHSLLYEGCLMVALAFGGRVEALSELFQTRLHKLSVDTREFWIGTAELAAGRTEAGRKRLLDLRGRSGDALIRTETLRRLELEHETFREPISPANAAMTMQVRHDDRSSGRVFGNRTWWPTPAVILLIVLNLAMFLAEMLLGGSTNPETLHQLGALDLLSIQYAGEYWRLITSLFLHFGPLHLLFNLYALSVIGPGLEEAIGSVRFAICYLVAGFGSSTGVLLLHSLGLSRTEQLVGASGCVMGLVGVWAGILVRHRSAPHADRRLKNILVIVAIQTAFDLSTPQISMAAHMSGLITGAILGLLISPRSLPQ